MSSDHIHSNTASRLMITFGDILHQTPPVRHWLLNGHKAGCGLLLLGLMTAGAVGWYLFLRPSDAQLLRKAIHFADRGERDAAIALFDQLLRRNPSESTALLHRGKLAREAGDPEAAARFWQRVPDQPPHEAAIARFLEGTLFLEAYRAREAEAAFRKAIQLDPDFLESYERLLSLYVLQLREPGITQELEAIRRIRPLKPNELYELVFRAEIAPDRDLGIPPTLTRFVENDPADLDSLVAKARYSVKNSSKRSAAEMLQDALSKRPGEMSIRAYLAEIFLAQDDLRAACDALAGAPLTSAALPCVWKSHGLYGMAAGDWRRATVCLRRYLAMNPNDLAVNHQLLMALKRSGDSPAAERQAQHVELLTQLRRSISALENWQPPDRASRHESPQSTFIAVVETGTLLMKLDRHAEAAAFFESALAFDPKSAVAREKHALALERLQPGTAAGSDDLTADELAETDLAVGPADPAQACDGSLANVALGKQELPRILLVDRHREAGLEFQYFNGGNDRKSLLETTGGGVAVLDYDGDGWPDLYLPQGGRIPPDPHESTYIDRLYRNLGDGTCSDVTAGSGLGDNQYSQGCAAGDYNNDGFPDLAVANFGYNVLYRNNGDGTFTDVTSNSQITGRHWSTSLAWGDLDGDGDLDLYVVNYVRDPWLVCPDEKGIIRVCNPRLFEAEDDVLYMNRGDGGFDDITRAAGIASSRGRGLGVVIADLDDDGWPDVFVANDGDPNFLYQNLGNTGQGLCFAEMGLLSGSSVRFDGNVQAAMGIACGDLDGDGRLDLYVTNFYQEPDALYLNRGDLLFEDASIRAGIAEPTQFMLGWGTQPIDLDLDGRPELFLTNGHLDNRRDEGIPWKMPAQLFYNLAHGKFTEISRASGEFFYGEAVGRGVARLDWDRDGRPDLVVVHQDRPVALLRNETASTGHRLILELHGVESNRDAIGARIRATSAGTTQLLVICGGDGFMATNERRQIVGIGTATKVDVLEIQWPSGRKDRWTDIPGDVRLRLIEGQPPVCMKIDADSESR
jgi:tetratricopeptide (TPR) repeat protein